MSKIEQRERIDDMSKAEPVAEGTWAWALAQLKAGKKAQRKLWAEANWIFITRGDLRWWDDAIRGTVNLALSDLEATDWQIAEAGTTEEQAQ